MLEARRAGAPRASSNREFGLVMAGALAVFTALSIWKRGGWPAPYLPAGAAVFLFAALLFPRALGPFNQAWRLIGLLLHQVMSPVILGVLYFLILSPFAFFFRLVKRDPLRLKLDPAAPSYWIERTDQPGKGMTNQF